MSAPKTIEEAWALPEAPVLGLTFGPTKLLDLMPVEGNDILIFQDEDGTPREVVCIDGRWYKKELYL